MFCATQLIAVICTKNGLGKIKKVPGKVNQQRSRNGIQPGHGMDCFPRGAVQYLTAHLQQDKLLQNPEKTEKKKKKRHFRLSLEIHT